MKFVRGLAAFSLLASALPLAIACGAASDNNLFSSGGGAKAVGTAGAATSTAGNGEGGASTSAGAPATSTAGADAVGDAGESNGGTSGGSAGGMSSTDGGAPAAGSGTDLGGAGGASAGSGGSAGSAGSTAGVGCPASVPKPTAACNVTTPNSCFYPGIACSCLPTGNGGPGPGSGNKAWGCHGTTDKCPESKPTAGLTCKANLGASCPYPGSDYCACVGTGNEAKWMCQPPNPTCNGKPAANATCQTARTCSYGEVACFCNASNWACEDD